MASKASYPLEALLTLRQDFHEWEAGRVPALRLVCLKFGHDGPKALGIQAERLGRGIEAPAISYAAQTCRP